MKITILSDGFPPAAVGGAEVIAHRSAAALAAAGQTVTVLTTSSDIQTIERGQRDGCAVVTIPSNVSPRLRSWLGAYHPAAVRAVDETLAADPPDVVHAHNLHTQLSFGSLRAAARHARRVFLTAHDPLLVHYDKFSEAVDPSDLSPQPRVRERVSFVDQLHAARWRYNPFRGPAIRWALASVTRVFAVSNALGRILIASGAGRVSTLHNGISVAAFRPDPSRVAELRKHLGVAERPVILFAGRPTRAKGIEVIRQAFQRVEHHPTQPVLLVCSPQRSDTAREGAVIRASFAPQEMPSVYGLASFVVVPSIYPDPFPTVNLEAGAAGRAVVGTCFGGTPEVVLNGETGIIVNPFNINQLARAMTALLDDPGRAHQMGGAAHTRIAETFSLNQHIKALLASYENRELR
ncbi:glycosyltransferase family 4 protein [Candidatus Parcubacteria bacterium]|nr:glycosyltransferase family 4 protein [Candidatus Parcubacteria bacterium]MBI4099206.1 glycosyltransferase family 4 protein [Candidatus Parcubacteria bacterium]MBI4385398.1 glycosyltransferase family 4 protein [Candidatus Parcubacteria bacterium]